MINKKRLLSIAAVCLGIVLLLLFAFSHFQWKLVAWYLGLPEARYGVVVDKNVAVLMRDGVKLAADLYRPDALGKFPVVLIRTIYGKENPEHKYGFAAGLFASQGFVVVVQDARGKFGSGGEYYPYVNEARDGFDTIEWAGVQPWSTGKVGMYGISYWGSTQWLAAPERSRFLKAIIPIMTGQDVYRRWIYNGIFRITDVLTWHYENEPRRGRSAKGVDWDRAVRHLPLNKADKALGGDIPAYKDWLNHPVPGPYWERVNVENRVPLIRVPALIIDGWYDYYLDLAVGDYRRMRERAGSPEARKSMLLIGPWTHTTTSKFDDADFGKEASFMKQVKVLVLWLNYWLKGEDNGLLNGKPVRYFVMGRNEW